MHEKYFVFEPWRGGLGNVIMSYECALALGYITKRKIIIPPTVHLGHISYGDKEQEPRYWDLFDEETTKKEFDIVEYFNHDEFKNEYQKLQKTFSWINDIDQIFSDSYSWITNDNIYQATGSHICFVHNQSDYDSLEDFKKFSAERKIIDLNRPEKYLIFNKNLFQNFWYMIYPGLAAERNLLKRKINSAVKYHKKYYDLFDKSPMKGVGNYNAVHVRRNDFFVQFAYALKTVDQSEKLVQQLLRVFDTKVPLYITTDEKDLTFFDEVKKLYKEVYISTGMHSNLNALETALLDQIICSRANIFYGTQNSTYSRRINIMRGLENRAAHDNMGINNLDNPSVECGYFPWLERHDRQWSWNSSAYLQWTYENESMITK